MASPNVSLNDEVVVFDGTTRRSYPSQAGWLAGSLLPKEEWVSLTGSTFTALSPPSGAKAVRIWLTSADVSLTLKGVTGDTGVVVSPASAFAGMILNLSLGTSPSIGFANGTATARVVRVLWL